MGTLKKFGKNRSAEIKALAMLVVLSSAIGYRPKKETPRKLTIGAGRHER